ncbi:response regulator [Pseudodesulfovibrio sp. zrk46]|uniref:response regulator n=1 Tax=Pseudodesulfovibrio sp. zrk46 TaxID=2725288 RepID=UPI001449F8C4|nr:response regulator [Pseudodesulfovibrio sp. zrk46]QJB55700.1 response regulator [Pseudodesulfovibrio sp. zrk46]
MRDSLYFILLVDDSPNYRALLSHYLGDLQCEITEARDGEEAVELFAEKNFDLIIMDIIMPLMDGVDAIRAIRKLEREQRRNPVPILALSGESSLENRVDSMGAGADRMLTKIVDEAGAVATVREMLGIALPA